MDDQVLHNLLSDSTLYFTFTQKRLIRDYIKEIGLKKQIAPPELFQLPEATKILSSDLVPAQRGKFLFEWLRKVRYPFSQGKPEFLSASSGSISVAKLNSNKKLINRYCYGEGVFDLKEYVLSLIRFCPMDCAYCFLREVYEDPKFKIPPDFSQIELELKQLRNSENGIIYLNAGENADSMILDAEYQLCSKLWKIIEPLPNVFIEFRTKTNKVGSLIKIRNFHPRLIAAFSLTPEEDRQLLESNTATIHERIQTMNILKDHGFMIGLRLEPILFTKNYAGKYEKLLDHIFSVCSINNIHSISLGCLRLTKGLGKMLRTSHAKLLAEDWVWASDKKYRYYRGIRVEIYRHLIELLKKYLPNTDRVILSAEPSEVWQESNLSLKTMPNLCAT